MTNLWSREKRKGNRLYVDLFDGYDGEEWDSRLQNSTWKHKFLHFQHDAVKSETTAKVFGDQVDGFFRRNQYRQAIEMCNQAMCFTQSQTVQMGILYAKRGFNFFHMEKYMECFTDLLLALDETSFSDESLVLWNEVFEAYKSKCMTIILTPRRHIRTPITPELSFDADNTFPCMANVLEIRNDAVEPYIVAKADIDVGQTVLVEKSFTAIAVGYDRAYCFTCLKTCKNFIPCLTCTDVMFCSKECKESNEIHEIYSCGEPFNRMPIHRKFIIQSILEAISMFLTPNDLIKFVEATLSRKDIDMETNDKIRNYGLFIRLKTSSTPVPIQYVYEAYTTLMTISLIQGMFTTQSEQRFLMHLIGHHTQILIRNAYGGFEKNQKKHSVATMANVAALFQHSCTPNLIQFTIGNQIVHITNQPVKKGDQLYIDYSPDDHDYGEGNKERKDMLRKCYGIVCTCDKCNPQNRVNHLDYSTDESFMAIMRYRQYITREASAYVKRKCVTFLQQNEHRQWTKEKEIVTDAYSDCLWAEFQNGSFNQTN